jgi:hypothetical protein
MSVEFWKAFFDWGTAVLIGLTFVFGVGALITGDKLGKRQDAQLREFDKELADAKAEMAKQQTRAATAERKLLELQRSSGPRHLSMEEQDQLVNSLPQKAFNRVLIVSPSGNGEAASFGDDFVIVFERLHWTPARWFPPNVRAGGTSEREMTVPPGITIGVQDPLHPPAAALSLQSALEHLDFPFFSKIGQASPLPPGGNSNFVQLDFVIGEK